MCGSALKGKRLRLRLTSVAQDRLSPKPEQKKQQNTCNLFCSILPNELNSDDARLTAHVRTCLAANKVARFFLSWVVKRTTSLFNSFCINVAKQVNRFSLPISLYLTKQGTGPMTSVLTHLLTIGGPNAEIRAEDLWCAQFCYLLKSLTLSATATLAPFSSRRETIPVCFFCVALRRGVSPSYSGKSKNQDL